MTERPILFSAPMVRAILEGRKVQTRRPVKPQPGDAQWIEECAGGGWMVVEDGQPTCASGVWDTRERAYQRHISFPYTPGMRLWVRETHWMDRRDPTMVAMDLDGYVVARSGYETGQACDVAQLSKHEFWRKRPSIHMPRWASRILLEVTAVRVERLQDISEADAIAEGVERVVIGEGWRRYCDYEIVGVPPCITARESFGALWEQINGPGSWGTNPRSWGANPWVWVVEFRRVEP